MSTDAKSKSIRELFRQFFAPEVAARCEEEALSPPNRADVDFAYVRNHEPMFDAAIATNGTIAGCAVECGGVIVSMNGQLTAVAFGVPESQIDAIERRRLFVNDLLKAQPNCLSVVHGRRSCIVGNTGSNIRFNYGFWLDDFHDFMQLLFSLDSGEIREV